MGAPNVSSSPRISPPVMKTFQADTPEPKSPEVLVSEPLGAPDEELSLERKKVQEEDKEESSKDREVDIYAEAALQCSIDNKEECLMCSG